MSAAGLGDLLVTQPYSAGPGLLVLLLVVLVVVRETRPTRAAEEPDALARRLTVAVWLLGPTALLLLLTRLLVVA